AAQTKLRVFSGGQNQRPDLMRKLFDEYSARNPGVVIETETGGATSDLQRQYLSTVLNAKDPAIDIYLIDIVNPALQGLSIQGAPIEGAVCTFLLPYWSQGREFNDAAGKLTLDRAAAAKGMQQWLTMVDAGVIKKNVAEVKTPDTLNEFKAGQVVFAINWGFAWDRFKDDADSQVKGKVGVMPLPAVAGGKSATCIGGWQWAVSAFSKHKAEAAKLVRHMASPAASKFLAAEGSLLPTYASVYNDPDVLKAVPWFKDAAAVVVVGKSRPMSRDYGQVSDVIRTTTSAVLARTKTPEQGAAEIASRLARVMR
ncbi:MAG TPA: extracellular solute-binding protein, partial [Rubrivivax sp.]|nr:extracellular solute-binding protein [Rubrivivax sp.]